MCGITARIGAGSALDEVLSSLENLEYRGYDSAGVAVRNGTGLKVFKREGEIADLRAQIPDDLSAGGLGLGHTRWCTHGPPTTANAHPHTDCSGHVAVVHNGIVENHAELKAELVERGHEFESETDTEVIPHLVEEYLDDGLSAERAFRRTVAELEGSYAVAMASVESDAIFAARQGSPLALGVDDEAFYLASDVPAFLEFTDRVVYLEDGDVVVVTPDGYRLTDLDGEEVAREPRAVGWDPEESEKKGYDHYMCKEIHEQPTAVERTISSRLTPDLAHVVLEEFPPGAFADVTAVHFVACGTSYHAAQYGTHLLAERGVPAGAYLASEYVTNPHPVDGETLVVGVTQSGETADTLEALRTAGRAGARTLALTNVVESTAARECDDALLIRAGPEIGVAATKTFSSQVAMLALLTERLAEDVGLGTRDDVDERLSALLELPDDLRRVLAESRADAVVEAYRDRESYFFIGRGTAYPVACEGALKFKEITYEHAEGFAAGELKHGPLALVTPETPVVAVFTGRHDEKTMNNVKEVKARGAPVIAIASEDHAVAGVADEVLTYPDTHPDVAGVLANVHLQLVAYHFADMIGRAIDKPRNLAKSVTVE